MAGQDMPTGDRPHIQQVIEQIIEAQISQTRKEDVLEIYEDLIATIWGRIYPTLGRVAVIAIMGRALVLTKEKYPLIRHLQVITTGVDFSMLRQQIGDEERDVIREALRELIADLIDILAMLTGDILVRQLLQEMQGRTQQ